jgi:hypothetical protein
MPKYEEKRSRDEAEMRAFYKSCGISPAVIDGAIRIRYHEPIPETSDEKNVTQRRKRHSDPRSQNR